MTTKMTCRMVLALALALGATGCEKEKSDERTAGKPSGSEAKAPSGQPTAKPPSPVTPAARTPTPTAPTPAPAPAPAGSDPEAGDFTLDEATEGLAGDGKLIARITTDEGKIECELLSDLAPMTVASFVGLARGIRAFRHPESRQWVKEPFFDGLAFHRVIPNFMIQGGDPLSRNYAHPAIGTGDPGYVVPDEITPALKFDRPGRMAMANAGRNSAGSQFFITDVAMPRLNGGYTIFGQCGNIDVVKAIAGRKRNADDKPNEPVTMKVEIFRR